MFGHHRHTDSTDSFVQHHTHASAQDPLDNEDSASEPELTLADREKELLLNQDDRLTLVDDMLAGEIREWLNDLNPDLPLHHYEKEEERPPQGWFSWATSGLHRAAVSVKNTVVFAVMHPLQSVSSLGVAFLSLATSGQPIINAALNPSGAAPKDIGPALLETMSLWQKIETGLSAISATLVNYPLNKSFIKEAYSKVKASLKEIFVGFQPFIKNMLAIYLAIMAGFTSGVLAQEAFSFINTGIPLVDLLIPLTMAGLSGFITAAARYLGTKKTFAILHSFFSHDAQVQKKAADALKHLKAELSLTLGNIEARDAKLAQKIGVTLEKYNQGDMEEGHAENLEELKELEFTLKDILQLLIDKKVHDLLKAKLVFSQKEERVLNKYYDKSIARFPEDEKQRQTYFLKKAGPLLAEKCQLNEADYEYLFTKLTKYAAKLEKLHPDNIPIFNEKKWTEYVCEYTRLIGYTALALIPGVSGWLLYTQKAVDGINSITGGALRDNIHSDGYLAGIGAAAGSGSAAYLLHFSAAREFLQLLCETVPTYLYRHPKQIPYVLGIFAINYFASGSLHRIGISTYDNPNFIFPGLMPDKISQEFFSYLVQEAAFNVNILPFLRRLREKPADANHPKVDDIIRYHEDPTLHAITTQSAEVIAKHLVNSRVSFFKHHATTPTETPALISQPDYVREDSLTYPV